MWRNTGGLGGEEMMHCGEKRDSKQNASESCFQFSFILSPSREEEGGGRRRERRSVGSLCSCLAAFQPADGLMAELRVEREAEVRLQLRMDPLQSTPTQHGGSQTKRTEAKVVLWILIAKRSEFYKDLTGYQV